MFKPKYYSLIDMDNAGNVKTGLIPSRDEKKLATQGKPYLEEVVEDSYWLHSPRPLSDTATLLCPKCGAKLKLVVPADEYGVRNSIYHCDSCSPRKGR